MSKILCYSVKLRDLVSISEKAYLAISYNGAENILPKSQVRGRDYTPKKSTAYWISAWILEKKNVQFSSKKKAWLDSESGKVFPDIVYTHHVPEKVVKIKENYDDSLFK